MIKNYLLTLFLALGVIAFSSFAGPQTTNHPPHRVTQIGEMTEWGIPLTPCARCGTTNGIEVHHIYPQHLWPERVHDTNNMICLCRNCHFRFAHRYNWTNAVTNLVRMIKEGKK